MEMAAVTIGMVLAVERGAMVEQGKKKLRSFYWRLRAEMRRQMVRNRRLRKQRFSFHYDPFSYALNFDDGIASSYLC